MGGAHDGRHRTRGSDHEAPAVGGRVDAYTRDGLEFTNETLVAILGGDPPAQVVGLALDGAATLAVATTAGPRVFVHDDTNDTWTERTVAGGPPASSSIGVRGDVLVVGDARDGSCGAFAGAAIVYELINDAFVATSRIGSYDPRSNALFGTSVALAGGRLAVGGADSATLYADDGGFDRARFFARHVLVAPPDVTDFGRALDLTPAPNNRTVVVIGAPGGDGAVFIYDAP